MPASNGRRRSRPFKVAILNLKQGDADDRCGLRSSSIATLTAKGVDVLYDDRDQRPGAKFATADLIGVPWQVLVGPKGLPRARSRSKRRADGSREHAEPRPTRLGSGFGRP